MKTVRSLLIPASVLVMFLGLAATGMKAQSLRSTHFAGKFTLPFMAQWGEMILPAGDYNLYFGSFDAAGLRVVEVAHEDMGIVRGLVFPRGRNDVKGEGNFLVCILEGNKAYVRSLQMAELGQSIEFARPHGVSVRAWIVASKESHNANPRLAATRIPVVPMK